MRRKFLMKPSSLRISAILTFSFEDGTSTFSCSARLALRMRGSRSAIGSVIDISSRLLPAGLDDARPLALEGELPEADAARLELPEITAGKAADLAAGVGPRLELRRGPLLHDSPGLRHPSDSPE